MHVIMQMQKHSNMIVERADFSFIMLRFLEEAKLIQKLLGLRTKLFSSAK